ncbi:hypothetical protein C0J52_06503 [Blattella germanica]|nr:hypothetical protein C0J52_06503 [Blattella germanica]
MTFSDFEDAFLKFCIKNKLFNLVFPCFKNYEISSDRIESFSANSEFKEEDISCFKLWLAMKDLNCSLSDDTRVFHAANEAVQYLSKGNVGIYLQDHPIVMLAIVMYGNKMLNDIFEQEDGTDFPINSSILQEGLKQLPLLQTTLSTMKSPSRMQDVTVYQLLQGSSPFDISKLFGWQKLHM